MLCDNRTLARSLYYYVYESNISLHAKFYMMHLYRN